MLQVVRKLTKGQISRSADLPVWKNVEAAKRGIAPESNLQLSKKGAILPARADGARASIWSARVASLAAVLRLETGNAAGKTARATFCESTFKSGTLTSHEVKAVACKLMS